MQELVAVSYIGWTIEFTNMHYVVCGRWTWALQMFEPMYGRGLKVGGVSMVRDGQDVL